MTEIDLGRRIKYFRERSKRSQFDLEVDINASAGAISRIENNRVNPTKETILSIADVLDLNNKEIDYLIGKTARPASEKEIERAKEEVKEYFDTLDRLAYLIDERWRIVYSSGLFSKVYKLSESQLLRIYGNTIIKLIIEDDYGVKQMLNEDDYSLLLERQFAQYYNELNYMTDDPVYIDTLKCIRRNSFANDIWEKVISRRDFIYNGKTTRYVDFKIGPININLEFSREPLVNYPRFSIVEYKPTNKFIEIISKIL